MELKLLKILSFVSIVMAYSLHPILWYGAFYHLTAIAFVALTRIVFLRSVGSWKLFALVMHVMAWNSLLDELFFDPKIIDYNEYFTLAVCVCIVCKNRDKWSK